MIILSYIYLDQGASEQAYTLSKESLAICQDILGDPHGTADSLITLCRAAKETGRYSQAKRWAQEGLEISRATNDRWGAGQTLRQLGLIHFELGEAQEAADLLSQSVSQFRETGDRPLIAQTLLDLGVVERKSDSPSRSKHTLLEAYRAAVETQAMPIAWMALVELAVSEMEGGKPERALELVTFVLENAEINPEAKERAWELKANLEALLTQGQIEAVRLQVQERGFADLVQEISV